MRRALATALAALALVAASPAPARAQHTAEAFLADRARSNAFRAAVGMDPALALGLGYMRAVDLESGAFSRRLGLHFDAAAILGMSSWDFTGGASMLVREKPGLDALATLDLRLKVAQNDVHTALVYGYGASVRPGWFDPVWYAALDLSMRGTFAATLFHADEYRRLFPNVADGTYLTDQLSLFAGVAGGVRIKQIVLLGARFAWRFPRTFETYSPYFLPYTLDLDLGLRF